MPGDEKNILLRSRCNSHKRKRESPSPKHVSPSWPKSTKQKILNAKQHSKAAQRLESERIEAQIAARNAAEGAHNEQLRLQAEQAVQAHNAADLKRKEEEERQTQDEMRRREEERLRLVRERDEKERARRRFEEEMRRVQEKKGKEEEAQRKLESMGVCPVGLRWVKQSGGWDVPVEVTLLGRDN